MGIPQGHFWQPPSPCPLLKTRTARPFWRFQDKGGAENWKSWKQSVLKDLRNLNPKHRLLQSIYHNKLKKNIMRQGQISHTDHSLEEAILQETKEILHRMVRDKNMIS